jgi:hypothetical protein
MIMLISLYTMLEEVTATAVRNAQNIAPRKAQSNVENKLECCLRRAILTTEVVHCVRYVVRNMYNCLLLHLLHVALCTNNDTMTEAMIITSAKRFCTLLCTDDTMCLC